MLLVFLSDEELKTEIKEEALPDSLDIQERGKRQSGGCHLKDYVVKFYIIDLTYVPTLCCGTKATTTPRSWLDVAALKNYDSRSVLHSDKIWIHFAAHL